MYCTVQRAGAWEMLILCAVGQMEGETRPAIYKCKLL